MMNTLYNAKYQDNGERTAIREAGKDVTKNIRPWFAWADAQRAAKCSYSMAIQQQ